MKLLARPATHSARKVSVSPGFGTSLAFGVALVCAPLVVAVPASAAPVDSFTVREPEGLWDSAPRNQPPAVNYEKHTITNLEIDVAALRERGETYSRLAHLYQERQMLATELGLEVVPDAVFFHVQTILDTLDLDVERLRIGLSDDAGLELSLSTPNGLYVAAVNPLFSSLERHSGRAHEVFFEGKVTDAQIHDFFSGLE